MARKPRGAREDEEFDEQIHGVAEATPESLAIAGAERERLARALEALPPRSREVLVLRELEGCSYKEIAEITGVPIGTVMSSLSRARDRLQQALGAGARKDSPMSCGQAQWLHGYFDGELDAARAAEFEAHLQACPACTQALAAQEELRDALGAADLYVKAPASLRARVRAGLPPSAAAWAPRAGPWRSLAAAASLLLVLRPLADGAGLARRRRGPGLSRQVLDAHLRSLQLTHLTDVASTDQHTVKPWFVGKLDFAPAVVDLASMASRSSGGGWTSSEGSRLPRSSTARRQHVINVFVWPSVGVRRRPPGRLGARVHVDPMDAEGDAFLGRLRRRRRRPGGVRPTAVGLLKATDEGSPLPRPASPRDARRCR